MLRTILFSGLAIGLFFVLWPLMLLAGRALGLSLKKSVSTDLENPDDEKEE